MDSSNVYEEVYEVLSYMDKITVMQIPEKILEALNELRNKNFRTKIDQNDIFNEQNISKEAVDLLCWLEYSYWMDGTRKAKIDEIKNSKLIDIENQKRKLYNPDKLFKMTESENIENVNQIQENAIVEYKESFIKKILNKIKNWFK